MAFKKQIVTPAGVTGEYFRITRFEWDSFTRTATAQVSLYRDKAFADGGGLPIVQCIGKVRLQNEAFDEYFPTDKLDNILGSFYLAAKAASKKKVPKGDKVPPLGRDGWGACATAHHNPQLPPTRAIPGVIYTPPNSARLRTPPR